MTPLRDLVPWWVMMIALAFRAVGKLLVFTVALVVLWAGASRRD